MTALTMARVRGSGRRRVSLHSSLIKSLSELSSSHQSVSSFVLSAIPLRELPECDGDGTAFAFLSTEKHAASCLATLSALSRRRCDLPARDAVLRRTPARSARRRLRGALDASSPRRRDSPHPPHPAELPTRTALHVRHVRHVHGRKHTRDPTSESLAPRARASCMSVRPESLQRSPPPTRRSCDTRSRAAHPTSDHQSSVLVTSCSRVPPLGSPQPTQSTD